MPELPEVEITRRGLSQHMEGAVLKGHHTPQCITAIPWGRILYPPCKAVILKNSPAVANIFSLLSQNWGLIVHLGMSGRFQIHPPCDARCASRKVAFPRTLCKHDHVIFQLNTGQRLFIMIRAALGLWCWYLQTP